MMLTQATQGKFFDTIMSYRHGSNAVNVDTAKFLFEAEPDAPASVD